MDNVEKQTIEKFDAQGYTMIKNESHVYELQKGDKLAAVGFHDNLDVEDLQKDKYEPFNVSDVNGYCKHEDDSSQTFGYDCNGTVVLITTDDAALLNHVVLGMK